MNPLVSVLLTTYNHEQYIEQSICSILNQKTDFEIELLIGEDCSTDRTLEICKAYADRYPSIIRLFASNPNKGLIDNYFNLVFQSKGIYLADCSGDDFWIDNYKLQKQVDILNANDSVGLVHTDWCELDMRTGKQKHHALKNAQKRTIVSGKEVLLDRLYLIGLLNIHSCTTCFRRAFLMDFYHQYPHFFDKSNTPCEDLPVGIALCAQGDVAYLDQETLCYRITGKSITSTNDSLSRYRFLHQRTELTHSFSLLFGGSQTQKEYAYQRLFYGQLMHLFRSGERKYLKDVVGQMNRIGYSDLKIELLIQILTYPFFYFPAKGIRNVVVSLKKLLKPC